MLEQVWRFEGRPSLPDTQHAVVIKVGAPESVL